MRPIPEHHRGPLALLAFLVLASAGVAFVATAQGTPASQASPDGPPAQRFTRVARPTPDAPPRAARTDRRV